MTIVQGKRRQQIYRHSENSSHFVRLENAERAIVTDQNRKKTGKKNSKNQKSAMVFCCFFVALRPNSFGSWQLLGKLTEFNRIAGFTDEMLFGFSKIIRDIRHPLAVIDMC